MPTETDLIQALRTVEDPELFGSVVDLGLVARTDLAGGMATVVLVAPIEDEEYRDALRTRTESVLRDRLGLDAVTVELQEPTGDDMVRIGQILKGEKPNPLRIIDASAEHRREPRRNPFTDARTRVIAIASGKGGVGKSSVATNLSIALAQRDRNVAAVDADVWGFSMPRMLGIRRPPALIDDVIVPPSANGVRLISMGFFAREDQAVVWRGPMLHKALEQFLTDVHWGEPDYLVLDMPPGTGDVSISIAQFLPRAEVVIVTTPQPAAQ
jgi:ATP-binding protein involved in chromosome partitioning